MFFFFKQKTAYELRISDWSSDVCSSDLAFGKPDEDRLADQKMADVQLDDLRNRGDWLDIVVGQPMTRMHLYPVLGRKRRRIGEALQLGRRSEEHTSELQSLMRISYAVFCLKKKTLYHPHNDSPTERSQH